jgi:hypothetical protein
MYQFIYPPSKAPPQTSAHDRTGTQLPSTHSASLFAVRKNAVAGPTARPAREAPAPHPPKTPSDATAPQSYPSIPDQTARHHRQSIHRAHASSFTSHISTFTRRSYGAGLYAVHRPGAPISPTTPPTHGTALTQPRGIQIQHAGLLASHPTTSHFPSPSPHSRAR